uniref:AIG1-type G domain-containing protein n=1 Tax=Salarias fasciatus TaxID=181472 RepID=A0A672JAM6_SALFA
MDRFFCRALSILISGGCPKIYQLTPRKEESGTVTRMTVGEKNLNIPNKTVLLVGEIRTGKSSLVKSLFNHMMGVTWEEEVWFQLVEEEENSDQSESQTSDVMVYQIFGYQGNAPPYSLTIIDTPGFGDIRGIKHDAMISERLLDLFRADDGVRSVHAVGLVVKSSENRLSDRLSYAFNSVMSLFGKDMERNIVALMTHSDGLTPQNALKALNKAKIKFGRNKKNQPTHFLFNNLQKKERTDEDECSLKYAWETSEIGMNQFTAFLDEVTPQVMNETVEVLNERVRLAACIQNLRERIDLIEKKRREIQQKEEAVRECNEMMRENKKYSGHGEVSYKKRKELSTGGVGFFKYSGAVCCTSCEENCHYPCSVSWTAGWCEVMRGGRCTVCSGKCPASSHVKDKWIYVTESKIVPYTNTEMKEEYERYKLAGDQEEALLENLKDQEKEMMEEERPLLDEAYQHVISLESIALNVDSVSTYVHYDFLIKKMSERGDQEKVEKLNEMKYKADEQTKSGASYLYNKMQEWKDRVMK